MVHYVRILDGAADVWVVRLPDLPGYGGGSAAAAIDEAAKAKGLTRSAFIASAALEKIAAEA